MEVAEVAADNGPPDVRVKTTVPRQVRPTAWTLPVPVSLKSVPVNLSRTAALTLACFSNLMSPELSTLPPSVRALALMTPFEIVMKNCPDRLAQADTVKETFASQVPSNGYVGDACGDFAGASGVGESAV